MAPGNGTQAKRTPFFSIVTLALWQARQIWRLLVVCGVGMLTTTVLVCMVPLYSQVALSTGLHAALNAASTTSSVNVSGTLSGTSDPHAIETLSRQLTQTLQSDIAGNVIVPQPQSFVQFAATPILSPNRASPSFLARLASGQAPLQRLAALPQIRLVGMEQGQLAAHVHLLQGRLPRPATDAIEIALPPAIARCLFLYAPSASAAPATHCFSVGVGGTLTIISPFIAVRANNGGARFVRSALTLRVVGLFTPRNQVDP